MVAFLRWASCRIFLHIKGPVGKGGIGCFYWRESTDRDLFCPSWQSREDQSKEQTGILAMCGKNIRQCSPDLPSIVPPTDETSITPRTHLYIKIPCYVYFSFPHYNYIWMHYCMNSTQKLLQLLALKAEAAEVGGSATHKWLLPKLLPSWSHYGYHSRN